MIRRSIVAVTVLAVGVVASVGVYQFRQADAAPGLPVTIQDADVDADGHISILDLAGTARYYGQAVPNVARPVAEQNLDGNGNIKVHEQGTVNVNVVSQGAPGRVIPLFENVTWNYSTPPAQVFVDVRDCGHVDGFLKVAGGQSPSLQLFAALDTVDAFSEIRLHDGTVLGNNGGPYFSGRFLFGGESGVKPPYVVARIYGGSFSFPTTTGSAWLYCTP